MAFPTVVPVEFQTICDGLLFRCAASRGATDVRDYEVIVNPVRLSQHTYRFKLVMVTTPPKYVVSPIHHYKHISSRDPQPLPTIRHETKVGPFESAKAFEAAMAIIASDVKSWIEENTAEQPANVEA